MQYKEIISVSGMSTLFQLVSSKSDGAIVRSLEDKSTKFISSRQHNFTPLESIEVYTSGENVGLAEVFTAMKAAEAAHPPIDVKPDNKSLKEYFKNVYPDLDEERVYVSDMKKMLKWYTVLKANDLLTFEEPDEDKDDAAPAPATDKANVAVDKGKAKPKNVKAAGQAKSIQSKGHQQKSRPQEKGSGK